MDGRKNNGGHKNGGRKSKAEEQRLIERLTPIMPDAYKALKNALKDEESWAVKLAFEYFFGKPKQTIDQTLTKVEQPLFPDVPKDNSDR